MKNSTISLSSLLLFAFLFCKLAGVTAIATWSWIWVLSPIWLPVVVALGIGFVLLLIYAIAETAAVSHKSKKLAL